MNTLSLLTLLLLATPVSATPVELPVVTVEGQKICAEVAIELHIAADTGQISHEMATQVISNCLYSDWSVY